MTSTGTTPATDAPSSARPSRPVLVAILLTIAIVAAVAVFVAARMRAQAQIEERAQTRIGTASEASLLWVEPSTGRTRQATLADLGPTTDGSTPPAPATGPVCQRVDARNGTFACLRSGSLPLTTKLFVHVGGHVDGGSNAPEGAVDIWGDPNRVRVSPSGRLIGWTVFREGDSYVRAGQFSTTAGIYDTRTKQQYGSLEDFATFVDGKRYTALDVNFWGVTFASDDDTFYATLGTAGKTYLLKGSLAARELRAIRQHVECPSLSPDGTRIAYKFRVGDEWRLHVLTLATGADVALAETATVDDQPAWLDSHTIGYGRSDGTGPAVFAVPADGSGAPRRLTSGSSPVAIGWERG